MELAVLSSAKMLPCEKLREREREREREIKGGGGREKAIKRASHPPRFLQRRRERRAKEESLANEGAKNSLLGGGRPFSKVRRVV